MQRFIPEGGRLCERVRRPSVMMLIGVVMGLPALAMVPRTEAEVDEIPESALARADAGVMEARIAWAKQTDSEVVSAWRARALEREADRAAETFARRYRIPTSLAREIYIAAVREGIDPRIGFGLVQTESSFRRTVVSWAGAVGYTQLLPSTARYMEPGVTRADLFDTRTNLRIGFKYLNYLLKKYDGDMRLALTAYNRGPGTVDRILRRGGNPENGYATRVLRHLG